MFGLDIFSKLFGAIEGFFNWRSSIADNITDIEVVEDKRDLEKAIRYASDAIEIADKFGVFKAFDRRRFDYFKNKFEKVIRNG